jgi:hypothetical protein
MVEGDNLFGDGVNVAARMQVLATQRRPAAGPRWPPGSGAPHRYGQSALVNHPSRESPPIQLHFIPL